MMRKRIQDKRLSKKKGIRDDDSIMKEKSNTWMRSKIMNEKIIDELSDLE